MKPAVTALLTLGLLVFGCSHANAGRARRDPKTLRVYNAPPEERYEVLGTVTAKEDDLDEVLDELRKQAADLGADAIIITIQAETPRRPFRKAKIQMAADAVRFVDGGAGTTP
jgi:hypothetical protein